MSVKPFPIRLLFALPLLFLISCDKEDGIINPPGEYPQVQSTAASGKMSLNSDYHHLFQVVVTGRFEGGKVECSLTDSAQVFLGAFSLHDDAGAYSIADDSSFASERSYDVAAGDGIFTRRVNSMFTAYQGYFRARFTVVSAASDTLEADDGIIHVYENQPPALNEPNLPDTLFSGFSARSMDMLVTDPQGRGDISAVWFEIWAGGSPLGKIYNLGDPDFDSVYTYYLEPSIAAGLPGGDYVFRFTARDSLEAEDSLEKPVYLENGYPAIAQAATDPDSELTIPDTLEIARVKVTAAVSDPQGLGDIDTVFFNYERPAGVWDTYIMVDNGLPFDIDEYVINPYTQYQGDSAAGDGIFTGMKLYNFQVDTGLHRFHIQCSDKVSQAADSVTVELWIHP